MSQKNFVPSLGNLQMPPFICPNCNYEIDASLLSSLESSGSFENLEKICSLFGFTLLKKSDIESIESIKSPLNENNTVQKKKTQIKRKTYSIEKIFSYLTKSSPEQIQSTKGRCFKSGNFELNDSKKKINLFLFADSNNAILDVGKFWRFIRNREMTKRNVKKDSTENLASFHHEINQAQNNEQKEEKDH